MASLPFSFRESSSITLKHEVMEALGDPDANQSIKVIDRGTERATLFSFYLNRMLNELPRVVIQVIQMEVRM
jgi:hypothetical protein